MQNPRQVSDLQHSSVGGLAASDIRAAALFVSLGISFAEDEAVTVAEACSRLGLELAEVERALADLDVPASPLVRPGAPCLALDDLCTLLVERHHAHLIGDSRAIRRQLAELAGEQPQSPVGQARAIFDDVADQLGAHLAKEENILFPALAALARARRDGTGRPALPFPTVLHPIRVMEAEHERVVEQLARLAELAGSLAPPGESVGEWRRTAAGLASFDRDLRAHMRFEDDLLFPRALELERQLP